MSGFGATFLETLAFFTLAGDALSPSVTTGFTTFVLGLRVFLGLCFLPARDTGARLIGDSGTDSTLLMNAIR